LLTLGEWRTLVGAVPAISEALAAKNTSYSLQLAPKCVSCVFV
jgi:hypothetical protein